MKTISAIQHYLKTNHLDAVFITVPEHIFYISGFSSNPHERLLGLMVFPNAEPFIICPKMEIADVQSAGWPYEVVGHSDIDNAWTILAEAIEKRDISFSRIAIEKSHLTVERLEALQQLFPHIEITRFDDQINEMRVIKNEDELILLRKAATLADYAIEIGCQEIAEGKTEMEILTAIENAIKAQGYQMAFDTMVLSGKKTASPHGKPGNRQIQKGDFILFDLGVVYKGYCSDITRTVVYGKPTEEQLKIYNTVKQANEHAIAAVKPGVRAKELDKVARDIITNTGYGEYFTHRLGHGLGISVHEFPSITGTNELILKPNMVFTIEPGIYKENVGGVRIEDDVVVTANGVEVLTKFTKDLIIIGDN